MIKPERLGLAVAIAGFAALTAAFVVAAAAPEREQLAALSLADVANR